MKLFTIAITTSIMSFVAGINFGGAISEQAGHAYWCGKIDGEKWAAGEVFDDRDSVLDQNLLECSDLQRLAKNYEEGRGTQFAEGLHNLLAQFSRQSEVASSVPPKSLASAP